MQRRSKRAKRDDQRIRMRLSHSKGGKRTVGERLKKESESESVRYIKETMEKREERRINGRDQTRLRLKKRNKRRQPVIKKEVRSDKEGVCDVEGRSDEG